MNSLKIIANNITQIYHVLYNDYRDNFNDEETILKACGVLDTLAYLQEGTITLKDIDNAVLLANMGKCSLLFAEIMHEKKNDITEAGLFFGAHEVEDVFLNFIMQIECLIFKAESSLNIPNDAILRSVVSKKKVIGKTTNKALEKASKGHVDVNIVKLVDAFINEKEFKELRQALGVK